MHTLPFTVYNRQTKATGRPMLNSTPKSCYSFIFPGTPPSPSFKVSSWPNVRLVQTSDWFKRQISTNVIPVQTSDRYILKEKHRTFRLNPRGLFHRLLRLSWLTGWQNQDEAWNLSNLIQFCKYISPLLPHVYF